MWTIEKIRHLLQHNSLAVERAILALYRRQTFDEQATSETKHSNGIGFSGADARLGTYYAQWLIRGNHLSGNHLERARKMVLKYSGQLLDEAHHQKN